MILSKKFTSKISKLIPCFKPSIDEFEFVTISKHSPDSPIQFVANVKSEQRQNQHKQSSGKTDRKKKRRSVVCPENEMDLYKKSGLLIAATKTWKAAYHRKKLMAFPNKKLGETASKVI